MAAAVVLGASALPYVGALRHPFLNWDDPTAIVNNGRLMASGVLRWALSTTLLDHYQPVSWLVWAATTRIAGVSPAAFHALGVVGHAVNAALVFLLALQILPVSRGPRPRVVGAGMAALLFAVHPLQSESVAWVSAFPYVLALTFLLLSASTHIASGRASDIGAARWWFGVSVLCYALSLLSRAYALAYPLVLLALDVWVLDRRRSVREHVGETWPYLAVAAVAVAFEWHARPPDVDAPGMVSHALVALESPFRYLFRAVVPWWLSPVYPLPLAGVAWWRAFLSAGGLALAGAAMMTVRVPRVVVGATTCWLLLLAPSLAGSNALQATADRYAYMSLVPLALLGGAFLGHRVAAGRRSAMLVSLLILSVCTALTVRQVSFWRESTTLWTRAVGVDGTNDIATFNLAAAYAEQGRTRDAVTWYRRTIELVPDHQLARDNLRTLGMGPARRGIALARGESWAEAVIDLSAAVDAGIDTPDVANALALSLARLGRDAEAIAALKGALRVSPDDISTAHNLARLLLEASDPALRNPALAESLALEICARTSSRDPRALETLAVARAAQGRVDLARRAAATGLAAARASGDQAAGAALETLLRKLGP